MSARTYICVPCRWSRRAEAAHGLNTSLRCPACSGSLWELEWRWRIPPKADDKGWKDLEAKVSSEAAKWLPLRQQRGSELTVKIDQQIANVEKQQGSAESVARLKKLKRERAAVLYKHG